jgi:DNA excision repair protein ERCC-6
LAIYLFVIGSSEVQAVLERKAVAFRAINTLRKLCNHPALMFHHGQVQWHSEKSKAGRRLADCDEGDEAGSDEDDATNSNKGDKKKGGGGGGSAKINWGDSGKLLVLSKVLPLWHSEGHKVLIFTQTRSMLNIIEAMVSYTLHSADKLCGVIVSNNSRPKNSISNTAAWTAVLQFNSAPG